MADLAGKMEGARRLVRTPWPRERGERILEGLPRRRRRRAAARVAAAALLVLAVLSAERTLRRGAPPELARRMGAPPELGPRPAAPRPLAQALPLSPSPAPPPAPSPAPPPAQAPPRLAGAPRGPARPPLRAGTARPEEQRPGRVAATEWRDLARQGRFDEAYAALAGAPAPEVDEPGDLLLLADVARLSRHPEDALAPLRKVLERHAADQRAPVAAFTLGRVLLDDLGRPREAAAAFRRAQALDGSGLLTEDALAREVEAWARAGDQVQARARALEYQRRSPEGRRLRAVRRFGGLD